jgi:hypothetical protein
MSAENMRVVKIDPLTDTRWLSFVTAHPQRSIYHHPAWIKVLQNEYRQRAAHLACENQAGEVLAVLPLLFTRGLPFNLGGTLGERRLSSLPRTPLAGPLSNDKIATAAIVRAALARSRECPARRLQIKAAGLDLENLVEGVACTPWRFSYILELPVEPGSEFRIPDSQHRARIKWAVSKAAKSGVIVRPAETDKDLRAWYRLYLQTMRRNVIPPRPYRFFFGLFREMGPPGIMELLLAEYRADGKNRIIAGSIFTMFGDTVSYLFNGMDRKYGALRANDAIQWRAINDACRRRFRYVDFGEVPSGNDDLAKFKIKWGAQPQRLHRYYAPDVAQLSDDSQTSDRYLISLARTLWKRMPLTAVAWLGDLIYSYL